MSNQKILAKGTRSKFDSQVLCPWAIKDVVADDEISVRGAVDMQTMRVHTFVEWLASFTDIHGVATSAKHHVDNILAAT